MLSVAVVWCVVLFFVRYRVKTTTTHGPKMVASFFFVRVSLFILSCFAFGRFFWCFDLIVCPLCAKAYGGTE